MRWTKNAGRETKIEFRATKKGVCTGQIYRTFRPTPTLPGSPIRERNGEFTLPAISIQADDLPHQRFTGSSLSYAHCTKPVSNFPTNSGCRGIIRTE